jgi:ADP-heptose:LPS heptosyltransferase
MTLSAVQQMRYSQCPNSQIIYWGSKTFVEILYHHPAIHQIITDAESVPEKATIINLDDPCPAAKYESLCNGNIAKSRHELFTLASGLSWIGEIPRLYLSREEEVWAAEFIGTNGKANIGIEVKSAERWRDYPHCEVLAAELLKMDFNVYAFDKEESLAISGVKNITGFPLRRVMALISKMNVIICPDSALGHIAGAMGIPLIGLFGPTCATKRIEIYGGRWISTKCPKMPCWYNYCNGRNNFSPCMEKIKIKDIINHLRELKNDKSQKIRNWFRG